MTTHRPIAALSRLAAAVSRFLAAVALLAATLPSPAAESAADAPGCSVYSRLYAEFTSHPNRLVGSENLTHCFAALSNELSSAGLTPQTQTFASLVQKTDRCALSYRGAEVPGALMLDNGVASWSYPEPLSGRAVYVGDASLEAIEGKDLSGAIAVIDVRRRQAAELPEPFVHGARAAVIVGDGSLSQWDAIDLLPRAAALIPCVYVDEAPALAAGLLDADGSETASIDAFSRIVDTVGQNLWILLPGEEGWKGNLDTEEVLLLSATLDTYGFTPDYTPDCRRAANAALLADVLCRMAKTPHKRTVVGVFFGSSYAGVEGARHFYHSIALTDKSLYTDDLAVRKERLLAEKEDVAHLLELAGRDDVLDSSDPDSRTVAQAYKKLLTASVNRLRQPLGALNTRRAPLADEREAEGDDAPTPERKAALLAEIAEIDAQIDALKAQKRAWNDLLDQSAHRRLKRDDPANMAEFRKLQEQICGTYRRRLAEIDASLAHTETGIAISQVFEGRSLIAHFDFDFAAADKPWLFTVVNAYGLFRNDPIDTGVYQPALTALGGIWRDAVVSHKSTSPKFAIPSPPSAEDAPAEQPAAGTDELEIASFELESANFELETAALKSGAAAPLFEAALTPFYKPFSLCVPTQRTAPTAITAGMGVIGFEMQTVGEPLNGDAMPVETPCDLAALSPQMVAFCNALGDDIRLSIRRVYTPEKFEQRLTYLRAKSSRDLEGVKFKNFAPESADTEGDATDAIAVFSGIACDKPLVGASQEPRARIESNNSVFMPMVNRKAAETTWRARVWGIGYAPDATIDRISLESASSGIKNAPIGLFYAYGGLAFSYGYAADPIGGDLYHAKTIIARQDAAFTHASNIRLGDQWRAFYANRPEDYKRIGSNGELLLGADETDYLGHGLPLDADSLLHLDGIRQGAFDNYFLNDGRLRILRQRNIVSDDLETLHADAKEHLDAATEAEKGRHWLLARAHAIFASNIANRVYGPLRGVTEDLVQAVVVLLLLNIPFAFAMERLIFGFTSIYKQVLGFAGFFLATFGILFVTHPAFSLASAPIVIFLAFVIILLSVVTVSLVMGKIKQEIRAMQGLASTVHGLESDSSTSLAAILIGISGMRNRPLKTFLTSVTVVLLTFTILVFASFTSRQGVVETYLGRGEGPDRIELHRFSFLDIDRDLVSSIATLYGDRFHVFRRGGLFRNPTIGSQNGSTPLAPERVLYLPRTGKTVELGCIMGVDPAEYELNPELARVAPGLAPVGENPEIRNPDTPAPPPIYLPSLSAETLGAEVGDVVLLNGTPLTFVGVTDGAALQSLALIDGFKVMPPDFTATLKNTGRSSSDGMSAAGFEEMDTGTFEWFSSDKVAVARQADLQRLFRWSCFDTHLFLYPRSEDVDLEAAGRELAPVFHGAVHCKSSEGARKMFFTKAVAGSGFSDVIIPLLLGGLIIFSSLMGSIVDREREIFTYSALGLAPPDVGALFFAESAVYSVIGGMGGYLLSQVVAKALNALGRMGVLTPPEMNFSSLTSVLTILIVMAVVMLSTIFPAIKAGKSANPGVARRWKMPAPKGNRLDFVFPFTVSELDFTGILSFIREHFQNHSDATLGSFAARDVKLFRLPGAKNGRDAYGIEANVSLAPFDLGIFQRFRMYSSEFEIKGIDEVVVELERIGGTPASWVRSNRAFADELRQQFLLWRSLPIETVEHYRAETLKTLGT